MECYSEIVIELNCCGIIELNCCCVIAMGVRLWCVAVVMVGVVVRVVISSPATGNLATNEVYDTSPDDQVSITCN